MQTRQKNSQKQTVAKLISILGLILGLTSLSYQLASAATLADTPLPSLPDTTKPTRHVYSVPDVEDGGGITTSFHCTSTEKPLGRAITWAVEIFEDGIVRNDVTAEEGVGLRLLPGRTQIISISDTLVFGASERTIPSTPVSRGSARIIADSSQLICTAFLADPDSNPTFVTTVPIIKKTTQKGQ